MHQTNRRGKHDLIMLSSKLHENQPQKSTADNASYRPFLRKRVLGRKTQTNRLENPEQQADQETPPRTTHSRKDPDATPLRSPECKTGQMQRAQISQIDETQQSLYLFYCPGRTYRAGEPGILKFPCGTRRRRKLLGRREGERNGGRVV